MVIQARSVPWQSSLEWLDVYKAMTSANEDSIKRRVVDQISFWELKSSRVPVAVSCTKLLLQAVLLDSQETQHIHDAQMMYALAILRFVNGHVDLQQQKFYAQPITVAASHMGIPCEIVNCRHRIAHNDMPSLDLLRHTAALCWEYLLNTYWHPQAKTIQKWCVSSIENSKKLTVALVTLLKKIETLRPPGNFDCDSQFYNNIPQSLHHLAKDVILSTALSLTTLKQKKQILKHVKRLGLPEQFLQNSFFIRLVTWCQVVHEAIPHCLSDLESCLGVSSRPELMLSFLKDFVFVVERPNTNCVLTSCVFWILALESPHFVLKLVSCMLQRVGKLNIIKKVDISDISSQEQQQSQFFLNSEYNDVDISNRFKSCALWIRAISTDQDEPIDQRMDRARRRLLHHEHEQREVLLEWLECLLLISSHNGEGVRAELGFSSKVMSVSLPAPVQFIIRLYCDRTLSKHVIQQQQRAATTSDYHRPALYQWMSSPRSLSDVVFLKKLIPMFHKVQARILAICQLYSKPIVMNAFKRLLHLKEEDDGNEILLQHRFVNIFNSVNAMLPPESNQLLDWLLAYVKARQQQHHHSASGSSSSSAAVVINNKLNTTHSFLSLNVLIKSMFQLSPEDFTSFQEQRHLILDAYRNETLSSSSSSEESEENSGIQDISTGFDIPWTTPETVFPKEEAQASQSEYANNSLEASGFYLDPTSVLQDVVLHVEHPPRLPPTGEQLFPQDEKFLHSLNPKKRKNSSNVSCLREQHKKRRGVPKILLDLNKHTAASFNNSASTYEAQIANLESYITNRLG